MALIAVMLVAAVVASQPVSAQTARPASVVPDGLFTDLVRLDRKLAKLVHDERTKGLDVFVLHRRVEEIHRAKQAMVDQFFDQPVYGVKFSEVFGELDCLDQYLELGYGIQNGKGAGRSREQQIADLFEHGKKCKQKLENELHKMPGAPAALFTDLVRLDRKLAKLVHDERTKGLDVFVLHRRVEEIHRAKQAMVDQFFDQPVYGVKFSEVFGELDCLDQYLELGYGIQNGKGAGRSREQQIADLFEHGKKCKQKLENELHNANQQPPPPSAKTATGSLSNGNGSALAYSIQTNTSANAFEIVLPSGVNVRGLTFPSGFSSASCSDTGSVEKCTSGTVQPNTPLHGSFDHTGTITANCGCVQIAFSQDNGATWFPNPPVAVGGPPSGSPPSISSVTGSGSLERGCQPDYSGCSDLDALVTFSGPITAFKVVLPSGYTNIAAHSNALVNGAQAGSCTSQTTNAPGDTVQCTMNQPQPAGTQIDAVFQTGDQNGFARMPSGSGADLYSLAPSQAGPWRLSGP